MFRGKGVASRRERLTCGRRLSIRRGRYLLAELPNDYLCGGKQFRLHEGLLHRVVWRWLCSKAVKRRATMISSDGKLKSIPYTIVTCLH